MQTVEPTTEMPIRLSCENGVAIMTLHRPEARNAINPAMRRGIRDLMAELGSDDDTRVVVLTGTDPAFSAGLDLKVLSEQPPSFIGGGTPASQSAPPWTPISKPIIGAVNGPAITGGFEIALNCDFRIASERARFADTHARVGVMPGWGLTALLADAVGRTRAREISLTGNFVSAEEALRWGLVNRVVPHEELMSTVLQIANDIAGNDPVGVQQMLATYAAQEHAALAEMWQLESEGAANFSTKTTPGAQIGARLDAVMERGRSQL